MINNYRFELSFKDLEQLKIKLAFLDHHKINKINIPCKGIIKKDFLLKVVDYFGQNHPNIDVIYHYSFFHQYTKNKNISYEYFLQFLEKCKIYKNNEVLLISGSKKKKYFDVLNVLNELKNDSIKDFNFGVAYNPHFLLTKDSQIEKKRLLIKLDSGLISSIWLQFGSNLECLLKEVKFLNDNLEKSSINSCNNLKIYGSLFIPSKQFLARFKYRPWKGVFISDEYLNSLETANNITKSIYKIYLKNNIKPLIETEISTSKHFIKASEILNI